MTSTFRANESKREEFRRYLEKGGVIDAVTRALVALYEEAEKPNNAAEFVRRFMGAAGPDTAETESLKNEVMVLKEKLDEMTRENEALKERLQKYENSERG
ncbi:unnamed protein product [Didymodactylos carnosus]|uniref:c-Myc-binding protein n=1 Tax=Didymodactylos carnosus TaxID=1234261 RepID=A0A8S2WIR5_9BILA|nr:unnamed protein product [Didymodactylos carnosus]CAF4448451.1 unnamed protein product [Didymodactylos carnosus]